MLILPENDFAGRTALITGGSRGIGREIAIKLARHGADVAIIYHSRDADARATKESVEREGVKCTLAKGDVSNPSDVEAAVAKTRQELGPISLLVTSAAILFVGSHREVTWESWKKTLSVNLDGVFLSIMAVKDEMLANEDGRIVCLSSVAALRARKLEIPYATSKAGIVAMVRCFSGALAPHVRINCIAPGLVETEMAAGQPPERKQAIIDATPLGRLGRPEEIANVAYFLLSDKSSFTTGQTIAVSGGRVLLP